MIVFNLSIMDTLGHSKTVLIIEVSIIWTTASCPDYRGVP